MVVAGQGVKKVDVVGEKFVSGTKIEVTQKIIRRKYYEKVTKYECNRMKRLQYERTASWEEYIMREIYHETNTHTLFYSFVIRLTLVLTVSEVRAFVIFVKRERWSGANSLENDDWASSLVVIFHNQVQIFLRFFIIMQVKGKSSDAMD